MRGTILPILRFTLAAVMIVCSLPTIAQPAKVWDTKDGRLCFEYWKTTALRTLNSHSGSDSFNAGKPYGFNEYGLWTFGDISVRSTIPPDGWRGEYESNMYKWWWQPARQEPGFAQDLEMRGALFPSLGKRAYVKNCMAGKGFTVDSHGNVNGISDGGGSDGPQTTTASTAGQQSTGAATPSSTADDTQGSGVCQDDPDRGVLAGEWETKAGSTYILNIPEYGRMTYDSGKGYVVGKLKGKVFTGCWIRPGGSRCSTAVHGAKYWGSVSFTFNESFTSFKGSYTTCTTSGYALRGAWDGQRLSGEGLTTHSTSTSTPSTGTEPTAAIETGIDRLGGDFHSFLMTRAAPDDCRIACQVHRRCRAWTYVRPGVQADSAKCWLKSSVPAARKDNCCTSGVLK